MPFVSSIAFPITITKFIPGRSVVCSSRSRLCASWRSRCTCWCRWRWCHFTLLTFFPEFAQHVPQFMISQMHLCVTVSRLFVNFRTHGILLCHQSDRPDGDRSRARKGKRHKLRKHVVFDDLMHLKYPSAVEALAA